AFPFLAGACFAGCGELCPPISKVCARAGPAPITQNTSAIRGQFTTKALLFTGNSSLVVIRIRLDSEVLRAGWTRCGIQGCSSPTTCFDASGAAGVHIHEVRFSP